MPSRDLKPLLYLESLGITETFLQNGDRPKERALEKIREKVLQCKKCPLHQTKTLYVFGTGNPYTSLMMIGEAPGAEEDKKGKPFVGRAGELLNQIVSSLGYNRERDFYIANVLKCRPPKNRDPLPQEIEACTPYLAAQIQIIHPKVLVALGRYAGRFLLGQDLKMYQMRGQIHTSRFGIPVVVTFHPAAALRRRDLIDEMKRDLELALSLVNEG